MPEQKDGRRFQSEAQRRLLFRNHPEVADKWTREEEEEGITEHHHPVEKVHPDRRINPQTGKEEKVSPLSSTPHRTGRSVSRRTQSASTSRRSSSRSTRRVTAPSGRNFEDMTREELRDQARGSGIEGWYRMPKDELARALRNA